MNKDLIRPLVNTDFHRHVSKKEDGKEVQVSYDDTVSNRRRRALPGRPAGTECGGACSCS